MPPRACSAPTPTSWSASSPPAVRRRSPPTPPPSTWTSRTTPSTAQPWSSAPTEGRPRGRSIAWPVMDSTGDLTDRGHVARQYADTSKLRTRRDVWGPGPEGVAPVDVLRTLVLSSQPARLLEIGCGTRHFARSVLDEAPDLHYVANDLSPAMVEATRGLGVTAEVASADFASLRG